VVDIKIMAPPMWLILKNNGTTDVVDIKTMTPPMWLISKQWHHRCG
jgi:hypothetical protein